ncbi:hypothetical protein Goklo_028319 [Gossypium klotzschianum]|uniref:Aminotransferase-like plant mobile domain-containing protein n=1 Tax=Gossypium klotzschianum TaxID=34286 RepID=A0A7J8U170_9ROSI|nr:hypothetical protein [Gossypium klotzschianum]
MGWLEENFKRIDTFASDIEKEQVVRTFILRLIVGLLMPNKSQNLVHLRWLLLLVDLKEAGHVRQESVVLAILYREMYQATKPEKVKINCYKFILQSWAWWNNRARHTGILTELEDIRLALYQQSKEEQRRYDYLPTCEPFLTPELVTSSDYIDWLRHNDKLYLLPNVERSRQCCLRRSRRASSNPRSGEHIMRHLRDTIFLYVACMLKGTKLDPPLISSFVERWRPEIHIFHLPCNECTITLEDIGLQLGLPFNGEVITGAMASGEC